MLTASAVGGPNLSATKQMGYRAFPGERPCLGTHAVSAMTRLARLAGKAKRLGSAHLPSLFLSSMPNLPKITPILLRMPML